jgi:hypothetical protein
VSSNRICASPWIATPSAASASSAPWG